MGMQIPAVLPLCLFVLVRLTVGASPPQLPPPVEIGSGKIAPVVAAKLVAPNTSNQQPTSASSMPLLPPPPICDDAEDLEGKKLLNESCKANEECYNRIYGSTICKSGRCGCAPNYNTELQLVAGVMRPICVESPGLLQPCITACYTPLTCAADKGSSIKVCQCKAPYMEQDGICFKQCKDSEFNIPGGDCIKRCTSSEILIDGKCKKLSKLDGACEQKSQCITLYATCQKGKCTCAAGFTAKNGQCQSKAFTCPFGDPLRKSGSVVSCILTADPSQPPPPVPIPLAASASASLGSGGGKDASSSGVPAQGRPFSNIAGLLDSCPSGNFCMLTSGETYPAAGATGHCCPKPKLNCPVGEANTTASCMPGPNDPPCPSETHSCQRLSVGSFEADVCCPIACAWDHVLVKDRCLPIRSYGDQCDASDQCKSHSGACIKGVCKCDSGFSAQGSAYYGKYCQRQCKDDEMLWSDRCVKKLKLGDDCTGNPFGCPTNAACSGKMKCKCLCGLYQLGDSACENPPVCPVPPPPLPPPPGIPGAFVSRSRRASVAQTSPAKPFVFCQIPNGPKPPSGVKVGKCGKNEYCAQYATSVGLCCDKPERKCQKGLSAGPSCSPDADNCGSNSRCQPYQVSAGDISKDYICCPILDGPIAPIGPIGPVGPVGPRGPS